MGKGDKKSKKGKIFMGSFGNSRRKKGIKARLKRASQGTGSKVATEGSAAKKAPRKKAEA